MASTTGVGPDPLPAFGLAADAAPDAASSLAEPLLSLRDVTKRFGGATALNGVDFDLFPGEIHGLIGENGAGKSTLMKILSGLHTPDEGTIRLRGESVHFSSPAEAKARGIGMIYQELSGMPALSIAENVFLGRQYTTAAGTIDWKRMHTEAKSNLASLGLNVDPASRLRGLSLGGQQLVEIARTVFSGADIVVLDEPTSALSGPEAKRLFAAMAELKAQGKSLVFISHFLDEVLAVSDRVTVMRNSRKVATLPAAGLTKHRMIQLMLGREADALADSYEGGVNLPARIATEPVLEIRNLSADDVVHDVSLTVHRGEILGLFGNLGAGMTEIARVLFGLLPSSSGEILLNGEAIRPRTPKQAKNLGIAYLSENRRATIFPRHEIYKNVTLAHLDTLLGRLINQNKEIAIADVQIQRTGVRPAKARLAAGNLSGGNQQKVVLAKWLTEMPNLLILNEPTRGMDVGAKREVLDLVKQLKASGVAIMLLSTEPETTLAEADRILVMNKGHISHEFVNERVSKDLLMANA